MSNKNKKPDIPSTKKIKRTLQEDLDQVTRIYGDRPKRTSCVVCTGCVNVLEQYGEVLLRSIEILQKYDNNPEKAAKLLIKSHEVYASRIRTILAITMETTNNAHTKMNPCPHMEDDGGCDRGTCCSSSSGDKPPRENNTSN